MNDARNQLANMLQDGGHSVEDALPLFRALMKTERPQPSAIVGQSGEPGFTMVMFNEAEVPAGTHVFLEPPAAGVRAGDGNLPELPEPLSVLGSTASYYTANHMREYARAALTAAPAVSAPAWQPIETAPKDGRKLILFYLNRNGKARTVMARWVTDEEAAETDADGVGLEGGWYECIDNWDEYSQVTITEGEPSHWMPLPAAPGPQATRRTDE